MLHGNSESGEAWYAWVPKLARRFRVVRPDMRGFGKSTPMPRDHHWSLDELAADYVRLLDAVGAERVHLLGAKIGGTVSRGFTARQPERVMTLTLVGTPPAKRTGAEKLPAQIEDLEKHGVEHWAKKNMANRLGGRFPAEGVAWWTQFMARTALSTVAGFQRDLAYVDLTSDILKIRCPTLVITTEESGLASVEENRGWQQKIPGSELLVIPNNSYHVAASDPDVCVDAMLDFIDRRHAAAA
jgi:pimeloyl-ACP methyl ester carboxylesterase